MLQDILNYLFDRKYKKLCDFLDPHLPFYGNSNSKTQEMVEEIIEIDEATEKIEFDEEQEQEQEVEIERESLSIDYSVEIVSTFEEGSIKKYTMYKIETKNKTQCFVASHRFQDFKKLHSELVKIIPTLGELPSSSMTRFSTSPEVVNERKSCLEKYLHGILQIEELQGYRPVVEFLNLHKSTN